MIHREIEIGRWTVDFLLADEAYDEEQGIAYLARADAPDWVLERAGRIMANASLNTGFTYTNPEMFRAVVVIGPTSSGSEFVNTLVHETYHLAAAIANNLGYDLSGEYAAYLTGDTVQEFAGLICHLGCDSCNDGEPLR